MDRRKFLTRMAAIGCSAAASPLITPVAFASAPWDTRLIVIILRGGMDGLDAFRPVGDPDYAGLRPSLRQGTIDLTGFFGMHPALSRLRPLWDAGHIGAAHAVSTPYRDKRSHFDGQDILEAGKPGIEGAGNDGWLNRMLQVLPNVEGQTAFAIGREQQLLLSGDAPAARWSPEADLTLSPQAQRLIALVQEADPLFHTASAEAIEIAQTIAMTADDDAEDADMMMANPMMAKVNAGGEHVRLAQFAAARLRGDTRIASFSINGWDTHLNQKVGLQRALRNLGDTILTLRSGLGPVWEKTAVLCLTEFGRTARENGTKGTDHGTGGAMVFAGGALNGGRILGDWPGLAEADLYNRRDLMPTRDVRAYPAWVMHDLIGVNRRAIEGSIFPGLDMGSNPGIVA
jgi:uncharacterized protein (DUF1501 family)